MVVLDAAGRPSFTALAERMHVRDPARAARLAVTPAGHVHDLRPAAVRRRVDCIALPYARPPGPPGGARPGRRRTGWCRRRSPTGRPPRPRPGRTSLEGVVAKRLDTAVPARGPLAGLDQGQVRPDRRLRHRRLAARRPQARRPAGRRARTGRAAALPGPGRRRHRRGAPRRELLSVLAPLAADDVAVRGRARCRARMPAGAHWVRPDLVVEVRYGNRTPDGRLRFPRFLRLRPDKTPAGVRRGGRRWLA